MKKKSENRSLRTLVFLCLCSSLLLSAGEEGNDETGDLSKNPQSPGIRMSGFVQAIAHVGIKDDYAEYNNRFSIRRARLDTRFRLGKSVSGRIQGDLTCAPMLVDAYVDLKYSEFVAFRMGRFKSPLSLERGQSVPSLLFNDFAYTASVAPNRDIGVAFHGTFFHRFLDLQVACVNGAAGGGSSSGDIDDTKDWVIHVGISPFHSALAKKRTSLLIGVGGSAGERCREALHSLKTPAGTTIFAYRPSAASEGKMYRLSPQFKFISRVFLYWANIFLQTTVLPIHPDTVFGVRDRAWTLSAGYTISGGERDVKGMMVNKDVLISHDGKGAFEIIVRIHGFHADPESFDIFVSSAQSAGRIVSLETGLNWYYTDNSCVRFIYARSVFEKGALSENRERENTLMLSVNLAV
ncbi:MAG: porin [Candidatus Marinimicrobia bacterium]|nr:porin [Candidatus Neomarinimicrobiota bacterium]